MQTKYGTSNARMISPDDLSRSRHLSFKFGLRKHSANNVDRSGTEAPINMTYAEHSEMSASHFNMNSSQLLVDYQNDTLCYEGIDEHEIIKNLAGSVVDRSTDGNMSRNHSRLTPSEASNRLGRNNSKILESLGEQRLLNHESNRSYYNK